MTLDLSKLSRALTYAHGVVINAHLSRQDCQQTPFCKRNKDIQSVASCFRILTKLHYFEYIYALLQTVTSRKIMRNSWND